MTPPAVPLSAAVSAWSERAFRAALVILGLAYVLIVNCLPIWAAPELQHDAGLFVSLADRLRAFEWLGAYNEFTLVKGPGFPLWLALTSAAGVPLLVANALLYAAGAGLLATALVRLGTPRWLAAAIFAIFLFNPAFAFREHLAVHREAFYMAQVSVLIGLMAWQVAGRARSLAARAGGAALIGVNVLFLWITREEGVWLLPGIAALALAILLLDISHKKSLKRALPGASVLAVLTTAIVWAGSAGVAARNVERYGVDAIAELKHPAFVAAYGALTRVEQRQSFLRVPVPRETMERIAAASPAFASLHKAILGSSGLIDEGCRIYKVVPCDGEVRAGWFVWLLRHAAAGAGHHRSGPAAMAFYTRLAGEVNGACDRGALRCGPERHTLGPPFHWDYLRGTADSAWVLLRQVLHYGSRFGARPSTGPRPAIERFEAVTLTTAWPRAPQVTLFGRIDYPRGERVAVGVEPQENLRAETAVDQRETAPGRTTEFRLRTDCLAASCRFTVYVDGVRIHDLAMTDLRHGEVANRDGVTVFILDVEREAAFAGPRAFLVRGGLVVAEHLVRLYGRAFPVAMVCAALGFLIAIVLGWRRRNLSPVLALALVMLIFAASRLGLLAYLDATSLPARPYLGPLYPLLLAFIGFVAADLAAHAARWRSRGDTPVRSEGGA